jgi:uncharacterized small protein (DUF1192 family)|nr:DUF1192 domain-containing protein [Desulfuromonadales bacterium]
MDEEDLQPRKAIEKPKDLDLMGVEELEAYLAELEAEMTLVRSKIGEKKSYREGASSLFKS